MADERSPELISTQPACPWCSAELPTAAATTCPSCGATLIGDTDAPLPGVTAIDAEAIVRGARATTPPRRSRILSWISGEDYVEQEEPAPPGSLSPPPPAVRREMLRLEHEAEVASLQAEADLIVAEAELEAQGEEGPLEASADAGEEPAAGADDGAAGGGTAEAGSTATGTAAETVDEATHSGA